MDKHCRTLPAFFKKNNFRGCLKNKRRFIQEKFAWSRGWEGEKIKVSDKLVVFFEMFTQDST